MHDACLTLTCDALNGEKLLDLLMELAPDKAFRSTSVFRHGGAHDGLSNMEKVMGRGHALEVQLLVSAEEQAHLLASLREHFAGTGLRYWANPLSAQGEI